MLYLTTPTLYPQSKGVPSLNKARNREKYRLNIKNGLIYRGGEPFNTRGGLAYKADRDSGIYAMAGGATGFHSYNGEIIGYVTKSDSDKLTHFSLFNGRPLAAAGSIKVFGGQIIEITDFSGHFCPKPYFTLQFIKELNKLGADLAGVRVKFWGAGDFWMENVMKWVDKIEELNICWRPH